MSTRLRFAPSPTGFLHLGGARTALFNWLYARHTGGVFLLRIEDTDTDRNTPESQQAILDGMAWLGMEPDEEIVIQSTRRDAHVALAEDLVRAGRAYRCYCTPEEVEAMRERAVAEGRNPKYDGTWRDRPSSDWPTDGRPFTIRFRMPLDGTTTIHDLVLGEITVSNTETDDFIIVRSDGTPTYNFVVVCDDVHMRVTHVVRGQDHVNNTIRQVHIYEALGAARPIFAHLPMIDGLSKRKGSASVTSFGDNGYLPEAVINYLARLGWSRGDQELFTLDELVEHFDLADVNKASGKFDDAKLLWVNHQWIQQLPADDIARRLVPYLAAIGIEATADEHLAFVASLYQPRADTLVKMAHDARWVFVDPTSWDEKAVAKWMKAPVLPAFEALIDAFAALKTFDAAGIDASIQDVLASHELGMGKIAQPLRIALTGDVVSPPIVETLLAAGHEATLRRMRAATALFGRD